MSLLQLLIHLQSNWHKYGVVILLIKEVKIIEKLIKIIKPIYNFLYNAMNVEATVVWARSYVNWAWKKATGLFKKN